MWGLVLGASWRWDRRAGARVGEALPNPKSLWPNGNRKEPLSAPSHGLECKSKYGTAWWGVSSPPTASGKSDPSPGPKGRRLLDRCWRAVRAAGSGRLRYGPPARSRLGSASLSARKGIHGAGCSSAARPGRPTGPLLGPPLGSLRWLPLAQGLPAGIGGGCGRALGPSLREVVGGLPVLTADLHSSAGRSLS